MNKLSIAFIISLIAFVCLFSMGCTKHFVCKKVSTGDLEVTWYRESYISSTRAFVSASSGWHDDIILDCADGNITDIGTKKETIIIKFYGEQKLGIYSHKTHYLNYMVKIDTASYAEWTKVYQPEFYHKKGGYKGK
jgi:hypothetical protein